MLRDAYTGSDLPVERLGEDDIDERDQCRPGHRAVHRHLDLATHPPHAAHASVIHVFAWHFMARGQREELPLTESESYFLRPLRTFEQGTLGAYRSNARRVER
jgi:hypothetical protein